MDLLCGLKKAHDQAGQTGGGRAINWKDKRGMERIETGMVVKGKIHFPAKNMCVFDMQGLQSLGLFALGSEVNEETNENVTGENKK